MSRPAQDIFKNVLRGDLFKLVELSDYILYNSFNLT